MLSSKYIAMRVMLPCDPLNRREFARARSSTCRSSRNDGFACGSWSSFTRSCEASIKRHFILSRDAGQLEKHPDLQELVLQIATVLAVTERISPENFGALANEVGKFANGISSRHCILEARSAFREKNDAEIWSAVASQLWGIPYSDCSSPDRLLGGSRVSWLVFLGK